MSEFQSQEPGKSGEESSRVAEELMVASPEQHKEGIAPFSLRFSQAARPAFSAVMEKFSLVSMVRDIEPMAFIYKSSLTESEQRIVTAFEALAEEQSRLGRNLDEMYFQLRWLSATPEVSVEELLDQAIKNGGNPPTDKSGWVHVGTTIVEDYMANPVHFVPGVLLVYDASMLTDVTRADVDVNPTGRQSYMHAKKPIPGVELRDALVGSISFSDA